MQSRGQASPGHIDMASVFRALKRSVLWLVPMGLLIGALTYAVLSLIAPRYQSEAAIAIDARAAPGEAQGRKVSGTDLALQSGNEAVHRHVLALQSPEMLGKVADDLKLTERAEFNNALGPVDKLDAVLRSAGAGGPKAGEAARDRVLYALQSRLDIYAAKDHRVIGIRATSNDPMLAAAIANSLAEAYSAHLARLAIPEADGLAAKVQTLTAELKSAQVEADRHRREIEQQRGEQGATADVLRLPALTSALADAKSARGEAEARASAARDMIAAGSAEKVADFAKLPPVQNMIQQRARVAQEIAGLPAALRPNHPRRRQLDAELSALNTHIAQAASPFVDGLDTEAAVAKAREDELAKTLSEVHARIAAAASADLKLRQREAAVAAKRSELEQIQAQLDMNRKKLASDAVPATARIVSRAQPNSDPVFPHKTGLSALLAMASLMFGTAWVATRDLFHQARRGARQVASEQREGTGRFKSEPPFPPYSEPLLQELPDEDASSASSPEATPERASRGAGSLATVSDIGALVLRLMQRRLERGGHRTMLTGDSESVDASREALALVKALAQSGEQVILVDWNPDGQDLASTIGLNPASGLNDLLIGAVSFGDIIQRIPGSDAHVIASGAPAARPADILNADRLNLVLDALDEAYDYIVVTGRHGASRALFEAIEGRFDTGIVVGAVRPPSEASADRPDTFLGFEVAGIDIVRFERNVVERPPVEQRIARVTNIARRA